MTLLRHLFDTAGFPNISRYGQSWEPWLIFVYVAGKGLLIAAYVVLIGVFIAGVCAWRHGRLNMTAAGKHLPRVAGVFAISCAADLLLNVCQVLGFWWPAYRAIGLVTVFACVTTFAASLKALWAYTYCRIPRG